jgi:hypothetical protein
MGMLENLPSELLLMIIDLVGELLPQYDAPALSDVSSYNRTTISTVSAW